jgi:hypothetical protein
MSKADVGLPDAGPLYEFNLASGAASKTAVRYEETRNYLAQFL